MPLKLVTAPTAEPLTPAQVIEHSRLDVVESDTYLPGRIAAARRHIENVGRLALMTQTWDLWLDCWPDSGEIEIPRPPLQSVTSVQYYDEDNVALTLAASAYLVDDVSQPGRLVLRSGQSWPVDTLREVNAVAVRFVAGWPSADQVPDTIKQAMLMLVAYWYENREAAVSGTISREVEFSVKSLLMNERVVKF